MSRIEETFARLRREGRRALVPFLTAGDPDLATTRELIVELARAGSSIIELGVPFSDPMADGPVIQRSSARALTNGVDVPKILETVKSAREKTDVPLVLFSYFNPLMQFGVGRLCGEAKRAGVDGVLVTDLAPEESEDFSGVLSASGLDFICLVAPTSTDERLRLITRRASGFVYAVSRAGVTGARSEVSADAERLVGRVRRVTELPVAVGFGISTPEQVRQVWRYADAAVVGSAIVSRIEELSGARDLLSRVADFTRSLASGPA